VVVNPGARGVSEALIRQIGRVAGDAAVFVSASMEQMALIARWIVSRGFEVVLCAGGDGTFTQCASAILALRPPRPPAFGVLRLGTGNALADSLGVGLPTPAGLVHSLAQARRRAAEDDLPLLATGGQVTPFVGLGADAQILQDYNRLKRALHGTPLRGLGRGLPGYFVALFTRSLWRMLLRRRPQILIRNAGEPAVPLDLAGRPAGPAVPRGGVLYRGRFVVAAASTLPQYGYGLRLFPQAERLTCCDRFQLRVINSSVFGVLLRLPAFFRGELRHRRIFDWACTAITMEPSRPIPCHVGGDEVGDRSRLAVELTRVRAVWERRRAPAGESCRGLALATQT
jgi:diacylglycerol kinase family enzyme